MLHWFKNSDSMKETTTKKLDEKSKQRKTLSRSEMKEYTGASDKKPKKGFFSSLFSSHDPCEGKLPH